MAGQAPRLAPPTFSVVIPTHDRPAELRECLEALARQAYPSRDVEVIVVDDGGRHDPAPIAAEFAGRLDVSVLSQANAGPGAARNRGAASARGRYLAFVDDDCIAVPGWLAAFDAALAEHHGKGLLRGSIAARAGDGMLTTVSLLITEVLFQRFPAEAGGMSFAPAANFVVGRAEFEACGGFDPSFRTAEDRELSDRWLLGGGTIVPVPGASVEHRGALTLGGFVRRHFAYGRGAYRFHRLRHRRASGRMRPSDLRFPLLVMRAALALERGRGRAVALVCLWQVCNLAGYATELLRRGSSGSGG